MKKDLHPLAMIALIAGVTLFGRVLPTWTLSLATIAASNALIALGIVVLARTGNVSFGQGLFFAAGGYGVALIANAWGLTDAVAQVIIGAACGGLLGLVVGPLIARYSGIFFGMLTLALSMVFYGALVKSTALGGSDGFNVGRPTLFGLSFTDPREADFMLYAVSVIVTGFAGIGATILFRSEFGLASLAVRENNLRVEYLGISANRIISINFVIAAIFAGASGAFALMAQRHIDPQFAYWTTSGEFVFIAVLAGNQSVAAVFVASMALELVRSFSNLYLPNTWQLVLGVFLLGVILFLPRGIGSLWIRNRRKRSTSTATAPSPPNEEPHREPGSFGTQAREALWRGGRRRCAHSRYCGRSEDQPDRRQRCRQDHLRQHGHGLSQSPTAARSCSTEWTSADARPEAWPDSASRVPFRFHSCLSNSPLPKISLWRFPASAHECRFARRRKPKAAMTMPSNCSSALAWPIWPIVRSRSLRAACAS